MRRIRNHPSLGLYVGRNEGYPPEEIDSFLKEMIVREHPGMCYIPLRGFTNSFESRNERQRLSLYVNGRRFIGFGGNWGFPEHLLNYRAREFDAAVKYHADMHFTMIRNWVGMTGQPCRK